MRENEPEKAAFRLFLPLLSIGTLQAQLPYNGTSMGAGGGTVPVTVTPIENIAGGIDMTQLDEGTGVPAKENGGKWTLRGCLDFDTEGICGSGSVHLSHDEGGVGVPTASEAGDKSTDPKSEIPRMANSKQPLALPSVGSGEEYAVFAVLKKRNGNFHTL